MKRNFQGTWYLIPALLLVTAALGLAALTASVEPRITLAHEIPGVNAPVVTVRLVETRTIQTAINLPAVENPIVPAVIVEEPPEATATFYFQPPDDPVIEAPLAINLVAIPEVTYRLEPLNAQPVRFTFVR